MIVIRIAENLGKNTFNLQKMKERLPKPVYEKITRVIENDEKLDPLTVKAIALELKKWALEHNATHFTHWFQPLCRGTAEKHIAFLTQDSVSNGIFIEYFDDSQLLQNEPDASSFPHGGMRSAFEARGYTIWDPSSPAFIIANKDKATLCIPSVFLSYTGDALDNKMPLLRSIRIVEEKCKQLLELVNFKVSKVYITVGFEQEFFVIDKTDYDNRIDLRLTGRTLLGRPSPRGQKFEDHYLGTIPDRILSFMQDLEEEAHKLGIPLLTRHNEVAPSQYEMVPVYQKANLASDHDMLLREIMPKIARKHGLECLFHEKPFNAVNGSGKHLNWSLMTDEDKNLLEPGDTLQEQQIFLLFVVAITYAIYKHSNLLRASIATPGNDFRLGGYEAPPAIISVYLGDTITDILDNILNGDNSVFSSKQEDCDVAGLSMLPTLTKHETDRNRTSPFAFTGNKFEFRAVGSSQSIALPLTFLHASLAEALDEIIHNLRAKLSNKENITEAIIEVIKKYYSLSKVIVFNGNNYSKEWQIEAEKRGLPNIKTSYEALQILKQPATIQMLEDLQILSKRELFARLHVSLKNLRSTIEIEAKTLLEMINTGIIPAVLRYLKQIGLSNEFSNQSNILLPASFAKIANAILVLFDSLYSKSETLKQELAKISKFDDEHNAEHCTKVIRPLMNEIRELCDELEGHMPLDLWPYSPYSRILHKV